jgi:hypothetical protein
MSTGNNEVLDQVVEDAIDLVKFYRLKVKKGTLRASEAATYLNCLKTLGLTEKAKQVGNDTIKENAYQDMKFPFPVK